MQYSFKKGIYKAIIFGFIFILASVIDRVVGQDLWGVNTLTVGMVLMWLKNFLKVKTGVALLG